MYDRELYRETFSRLHTSPETRRNIMNLSEKHTRRFRPARVAAVVAAAAVLSITAMAAAFGGGMLDWFGREWDSWTGQSLGESQVETIQRLTQPVGESVTDGNITVTVDSITVGTDNLWALLKVSGMAFSNREEYGFGNISVEITPDPADLSANVGVVSYGTQLMGVDKNGDLNLILEYFATLPTDAQLSAGGCTLTLTLTGLTEGEYSSEKPEMAAEGTWRFSIPLTVESRSPVVTIEKAEVPSWSPATDEYSSEPVTLTDIRISDTGIRFWASGELISDVSAVLKDGTEVRNSGGGGGVDEDGTHTFSYTWVVPVIVEDIAALRFGETEIPVE